MRWGVILRWSRCRSRHWSRIWSRRRNGMTNERCCIYEGGNRQCNSFFLYPHRFAIYFSVLSVYSTQQLHITFLNVDKCLFDYCLSSNLFCFYTITLKHLVKNITEAFCPYIILLPMISLILCTSPKCFELTDDPFGNSCTHQRWVMGSICT